jgi:hypothetical protein
MPPRITQSSNRPRVSDRTMVGIANRYCCRVQEAAGLSNGNMKPYRKSGTSFSRHGKSVEIAIGPRRGSGVATHPGSAISTSFSWVFLGRLLSSRARLRFPSRSHVAPKSPLWASTYHQQKHRAPGDDNGRSRMGLDVENSSRRRPQGEVFLLTSPFIEPFRHSRGRRFGPSGMVRRPRRHGTPDGRTVEAPA